MTLLNIEPRPENDNLNNSHIFDIQPLLYTAFIIEKKCRVDDVSKEMKISSDLLYRYIRGDKPFPFFRLVPLLKATKDLRILVALCREMGCILVPAIKNKKFIDGLTEITLALSGIANGDYKGGEK
jgi:hypothetical protein